MGGRIAICLGDVTGIGPEVTLKALAQEQASGETQFTLIGDFHHVSQLNQRLGLSLPLKQSRLPMPAGSGIRVVDTVLKKLPEKLEPGAAEAARAAVAWLKAAAKGCLNGDFDAMVTAPVNKEAIVNSGIPFVGQTELLSQLAETEQTVMMLLGHDEANRWLRVALVTTHVPIKQVAEKLTQKKIELAIELASRACSD